MAPMWGNLHEGHQHEPAPVHERMGEDEGPPEAREGAHVHDPAPVVDQIEVERTRAPACPNLPARPSLDIFQQSEQSAN